MHHSARRGDWPAARYTVALLLCAQFVAAAAPADVIRLNSQWLELEVDRSRGQLVALVDPGSGQRFTCSAPGGSLWELELSGASTNVLTAENAQTCRVHKLDETGDTLQISWSGFGLANAPGLRVDVSIVCDPQQALSRWQLSVEALGTYTLNRVRFPRILNLPQMARERLVVPFWAGLHCDNPRQAFTSSSPSIVRREYDYPGLCSMQFLAYYSESGPGVYLASDDTAGYRKVFAVFSQTGGSVTPKASAEGSGGTAAGLSQPPDLNLEIVHLPDRQTPPVQRYVLPYSVVLGTFRGDWFDAAAIYRSWATNQVWARESRLKRGVVPSWITDTGLWIWNRGRSPEVVDPAIAMRSEIGLPVSVFWHWWHGCAYDTGFPEYLPPREGGAPFVAALNRAHEHNVRALVYMNQRLWGMTTASWTNENAAAFAVKAADGQVKPEVYNTFTKLPCASMCIGTAFWRAKYSGLVVEAFHRLGVDGIYMDQACSSLACFDPSHGHSLGGGTYWMDGFKALAANLRQRCAGRGGIALAGEGCAENWLPYLDLMLALDVSRERYCAPDGWEPIPLFQAVYHGYATFFGSYSSLTSPPYDDLWPAELAPKQPLELLDRQFSPQFYLEQARAFLWGQQPTLANFRPAQFRERPFEIEYVLRLARLRKLALDYLQDGVMLPPPKVEVVSEERPMSRLSIYAGQQSALKGFQKPVPLVLASAWRAPHGGAAVAVASIAERPITARVDLARTLPTVGAHGRFVARGQNRTEPMKEERLGSTVFSLNLMPLEALVLEWKSGEGIGSRP
ncbi:MAG: DUF6259 domain-containing protein [Verrucomicrobiia bacterium]